MSPPSASPRTSFFYQYLGHPLRAQLHAGPSDTSVNSQLSTQQENQQETGRKSVEGGEGGLTLIPGRQTPAGALWEARSHPAGLLGRPKQTLGR